MISWIRSLICENKCPCDAIKALEKGVAYWKDQYNILYKEKKEFNSIIENKDNLIFSLKIDNDELKTDYDMLWEDSQRITEEFDNYKASTSLYHKNIPNCLNVKNKDNKDYVYLGGSFWKLYTNFDVQFRPFSNHYNFYGGLTSASMLILMRAGLVDNNTGEVKTGFTAKEVFDKILHATQYHMNYVGDQELFFFADNWMGSVIATAFQKGDCECIHTIVVDAFNTYEYLTTPFEDYSALLGLGYYKYNNVDFGHAFALLIKNNSELNKEEIKNSIWVGEATSKVGPSRTIAELEKSGQYYGCEWGLHGTMNSKNIFGGYTMKKEVKWWEKVQGVIKNIQKSITPPKIEDNEEKKKLISEGWKKLSKKKN